MTFEFGSACELRITHGRQSVARLHKERDVRIHDAAIHPKETVDVNNIANQQVSPTHNTWLNWRNDGFDTPTRTRSQQGTRTRAAMTFEFGSACELRITHGRQSVARLHKERDVRIHDATVSPKEMDVPRAGTRLRPWFNVSLSWNSTPLVGFRSTFVSLAQECTNRALLAFRHIYRRW